MYAQYTRKRKYPQKLTRIDVHRAGALDRNVEHDQVYIVLALDLKFRETDVD